MRMDTLGVGSFVGSRIPSGTLKVRTADGQQEAWTVSGGFFEVSKNRATVLADTVSAAEKK